MRGRNEMMTIRIIVDHVAAEPFVPFPLHTASGRVFEVRHPEFIKVGRSTVTVYAPAQGDPDGPMRWEEISLVLIESIAPLGVPVSSAS